MNTLLNMDPWGFLDEIFDTGSRTFRTMRARAAGRFPPVNVFLDDDAVLIDVELPGKTAADVDLSLEPQAVIIAGKKAKVEGEGEGGRRQRSRERHERENRPEVAACDELRDEVEAGDKVHGVRSAERDEQKRCMAKEHRGRGLTPS